MSSNNSAAEAEALVSASSFPDMQSGDPRLPSTLAAHQQGEGEDAAAKGGEDGSRETALVRVPDAAERSHMFEDLVFPIKVATNDGQDSPDQHTHPDPAQQSGQEVSHNEPTHEDQAD
jgi:hypothetical protein